MKTTLKYNEEAKKIYFNYETWSIGAREKEQKIRI